MKRHTNGSPGKAFADGYAKGKAESADTIRQLEAERNLLLNLLADLREAVGDHGRRMQPELVEYCRELGGHADTIRQLKESLNKALAENLAMRPTPVLETSRQATTNGGSW